MNVEARDGRTAEVIQVLHATVEYKPDDIFYDWMYGVHLHADEERLERVDAGRPFGMEQFIALSVAET